MVSGTVPRTTFPFWNVGAQRVMTGYSLANFEPCFLAFNRTETMGSLLDALNLGLVVRRQRESENGTARLMRIRPQPSSMCIDDGAAYRESNTDTARLRGVKRLEDPLAIIGRDAWSGVAYRDEQVLG